MADIITTTYMNPDLDGYGCAFAYAELLNATGNNATAHIWGEPLIEVRWLITTFSLTECGGPTSENDSDIILLDASDPASVQPPLKIDNVIEIIDHRKLHFADQFTNAKPQIELVGAAATLVAERFQKANITPSQESALYLFGGIISNTQNFTGMVTKRDEDIASWLKEVSNAPNSLAHDMFTAKSDLTDNKLQEALTGDSKLLHIKNKRVGTMQLEIISAKSLIRDRKQEILKAMSDYVSVNKCDYMLLNIKDVGDGTSFIFCIDEQTESLLSQYSNIKFDDHVGFIQNGVLRKNITSWIGENLDD